MLIQDSDEAVPQSLAQRGQRRDVFGIPDRRSDTRHDVVACWPSIGGLWAKRLSPVEMAYLEIDRFESVEPRPGSADEESFCNRLRELGADWYRDKSYFDRPYSTWDTDDNPEDPLPVFRAAVEIGLDESGGVWILRLGEQNDSEAYRLLKRALTMKERCEVLKRLGGTYCPVGTADGCPERRRLEDMARQVKGLETEFRPTGTCNILCGSPGPGFVVC